MLFLRQILYFFTNCINNCMLSLSIGPFFFSIWKIWRQIQHQRRVSTEEKLMFRSTGWRAKLWNSRGIIQTVTFLRWIPFFTLWCGRTVIHTYLGPNNRSTHYSLKDWVIQVFAIILVVILGKLH